MAKIEWTGQAADLEKLLKMGHGFEPRAVYRLGGKRALLRGFNGGGASVVPWDWKGTGSDCPRAPKLFGDQIQALLESTDIHTLPLWRLAFWAAAECPHGEPPPPSDFEPEKEDVQTVLGRGNWNRALLRTLLTYPMRTIDGAEPCTLTFAKTVTLHTGSETYPVVWIRCGVWEGLAMSHKDPPGSNPLVL